MDCKKKLFCHCRYISIKKMLLATIPAESFGTLIFLTSHQCIMLFYIPLHPPSTMLPLGEKTSFFFNIVMGAQRVIQGTNALVISTVWLNKSSFVSIWGGSVHL